MSDLKQTIEEIYNVYDKSNSPIAVVNQANSVESLATDIYSENSRFIYELIQNADDAMTESNGSVNINVLTNYVVVSHNGEPFTSRDVIGLCAIGLGTKTQNSEKTGYKGIGFKSVFGQPDGLVFVRTGTTLFRFDREYVKRNAWKTEWGKQIDWESNNGPFKAPWQMMPILSQTTNDNETNHALNDDAFTVKTAIRIRDARQLWNDIALLFNDLNFILFLRKVTNITFSFQHETHTIQKKQLPGESQKFLLINNGKNHSCWALRTYTLEIPDDVKALMEDDPRTPDKIRQQSKTQISIANKINNRTYEIEPLKNNDSPIYSFLPASITEFNFSFLVNGNFLLDASREAIQKDRIWNSWLFYHIGFLNTTLCNELAKNTLNNSYLKLLPNRYYQDDSPLHKTLNEGLKAGIDKNPLVKTKDGQLKKLKELIIDPFRLEQLDAQLSKSVAVYKNKQQSMVDENKGNKHLTALGSNKLSEDDLLAFFTSKNFQEYLNIENNIVVLKLISTLSKNDKEGKWQGLINSVPLIITTNNTQQLIRRVCYPGKMPHDAPAHYRQEFIHKSIYNEIQHDPEFKEWMDSQGVEEPSVKAYLQKEIIDNLPDSVNESNHKEIFEFLFSLYVDNKLSEDQYNALQNFRILNHRNQLVKAKKCFLSSEFYPPINISGIDEEVNLTNSDYAKLVNPARVGKFFMKIGVSGDITIPVQQMMLASELPPKYVQESYDVTRPRARYSKLIGIHTLNTNNEVTFFLQSVSYLEYTKYPQFSRQFWDRLLQKYNIQFDKSWEKQENGATAPVTISQYIINGEDTIVTFDKMDWGHYPSNILYIPSYLQWWTRNIKCIPTLRGLKTADKAILNSEFNRNLAGGHLPVVDIQTNMSENWASFFGVRIFLGVADLLKVYDRIVQLKKNSGLVKPADRTRVGEIWNELMQQLDRDFASTMSILKAWAKNAEMLTANEEIKSPDNLIWFDSSGFEGTELDSKRLLVPINVNSNKSSFRALLESLGVHVVEQSELRPTNPTAHINFKIKLIEILPDLTLWLVTKGFTGEFEKQLLQRLASIDKAMFFLCQSLDVIITHEGEETNGPSIESHFDPKDNKFYWTGNWESRVFIQRNIDQIAGLLSMRKIENELPLLITCTKSERLEFLSKGGCDMSLLENNEIIAEGRQIIEALRPTPLNSQLITTIEPASQIQSKEVEVSIIEELNGVVDTENQISTIKQNEKFYDEEEEAMLSKLFGDNISVEQRNDANIEAHVKGLIYCKHCGYDTSKAEEQFLHNLNNGKYLHPVIDDGKELKVMCRSATRGILYLGAYAWQELQETDTILYILIGDSHSDCKIAENPQQVESHDADYWILRREITPDGYTALDQILSNETEIDKLQILFHVGNTEYANIFKFSKNSSLENVPGNYGNEDEF